MLLLCSTFVQLLRMLASLSARIDPIVVRMISLIPQCLAAAALVRMVVFEASEESRGHPSASLGYDCAAAASVPLFAAILVHLAAELVFCGC